MLLPTVGTLVIFLDRTASTGMTLRYPRSPMTATSIDAAREAVQRLSGALEADEFEGWDPYDALTSPVIARVARSPLLRQAAIQSLKRMPINPRRLLGVP